MNGSDLPPRFQFAFRRMVFFLLCLCVWLCFGTLCFVIFNSFGHKHVSFFSVLPFYFNIYIQRDSLRDSKLDAKRQELLNVLWAETISQSQNEWAEIANQKMEMYEKVGR